MDKLPTTIIQHLYEYDSTYKHMFDKVLFQLNMHCVMYRCSVCFKPYNQCVCYCRTCRTYLIFCRQLYFDSNSMTEDGIYDIVPMTNYLCVCSNHVAMYYIMDELKRDETTLRLLKLIEDKDTSIKALSDKLEG